MKFTTLQAHVTDAIKASAFAKKKVAVLPGPEDPSIPGRFVLLSRLGGPGLQVEGLIDGVGYQIKSVGNQNSYQESEDLALLIDKWLIETPSSMVHGEWVVGIARVGSAPVPLFVDNADRTHFVCNYVATVKSVIG